MNLISQLEERKIHLNIIIEGIDTSTATGKLIFTILSAVAEMEAALSHLRADKTNSSYI